MGETLNAAEALARFGINPEARSSSLEDLEAYELHVINDLPVSKVYCYLISEDGKIYAGESYTQLLHIDERERGGGYIIGINSAVKHAILNPNKVVVLYSPPGPVDFSKDKSTPYSEIDRRGGYDRGQIYLMWSEDGKFVKNISLTTNKGNDRLIRYLAEKGELDNSYFLWLDDLNNKNLFRADLEKSIYSTITTPFVLPMDITTVAEDIGDRFRNDVVYNSVNGRAYTGKDIRDYIEKALNNALRGEIFSKYKYKLEEISHLGGVTTELYMEFLREVMQEYGWHKLFLGGSCGGEVVSLDDIMRISSPLSSVTSSNSFPFFSNSGVLHLGEGPFSTDWRKHVLLRVDEDEHGPLEFICPNHACGKKVRRPYGRLVKNCPYCGADVSCK